MDGNIIKYKKWLVLKKSLLSDLDFHSEILADQEKQIKNQRVYLRQLKEKNKKRLESLETFIFSEVK